MIIYPSFHLGVRNSWAPKEISRNTKLKLLGSYGGPLWEFSFLLFLPKVRLLFHMLMVFIRYWSGSYWFLFVSKRTTHLVLLPNGETWVFCGHSTNFPVTHGFMGNTLVDPLGWKSLRCSIVLDTPLNSEQGNRMALVFALASKDASVGRSSNMPGRNVRVYSVKFSRPQCVAPKIAVIHGVLWNSTASLPDTQPLFCLPSPSAFRL